MMQEVRDQLILRRDTHIDTLAARLNEARVLPIIDAIISGKSTPQLFPEDDVRYAIDIGLIVRREGQLCIANPIYQEIIILVILRKGYIKPLSIWTQ